MIYEGKSQYLKIFPIAPVPNNPHNFDFLINTEYLENGPLPQYLPPMVNLQPDGKLRARWKLFQRCDDGRPSDDRHIPGEYFIQNQHGWRYLTAQTENNTFVIRMETPSSPADEAFVWEIENIAVLEDGLKWTHDDKGIITKAYSIVTCTIRHKVSQLYLNLGGEISGNQNDFYLSLDNSPNLNPNWRAASYDNQEIIKHTDNKTDRMTGNDGGVFD